MTASTVPGRATWTVGWRGRPVRFERRAVVVAAVALAGLAVLALFSMGVGPASADPPTVLKALFAATGDPATAGALKWRTPRIAVAIVGGALLALGGALFQVLTRNPLGSPDIIGFNTGAYTGALLATMLLPPSRGRNIGVGGVSVHVGDYVPALGACLGGLATAALVLALSGARARGADHRLIVVGIATSATLTAVNAYIIMKTDINYASAMTSWSFGSLNGLRAPDAAPLILALLAIAVAVPLAAQAGKAMMCDDDVATAIGEPVRRTRVAFLVIGVTATAVVTAVIGPVMFVALAAPHIARGLTRSAGLALVPTAIIGSLLLLGADTIARAGSIEIPAGVVTMIIGGAYFFRLLLGARGRR